MSKPGDSAWHRKAKTLLMESDSILMQFFNIALGPLFIGGATVGRVPARSAGEGLDGAEREGLGGSQRRSCGAHIKMNGLQRRSGGRPTELPRRLTATGVR